MNETEVNNKYRIYLHSSFHLKGVDLLQLIYSRIIFIGNLKIWRRQQVKI